MDNLKQLVAYTIDKAKQLGAQDASCSAIHARELELSWRKAKIETLASAGQSALGIELYVDGRYGAYSTSDLRRESVSAFLEKNIAMTRLLDPDPARGLADPKRYENRSNVDLQLFDPKVAELSPENATDICKKLEDAVLTHKEIPITDATTSVGIGTSERYSATSNGFEGSRKTTSAQVFASIVVADGDKKPSDYAYTSARHIEDLASIDDIASEAAYFASLRIGQKKLPSANRTLILDRRTASSFITRYISPISGSALIRKQSYFDQKIGQKLASDLFDLHDDPLRIRGLGSQLFDAEGMSAQKSPVFDKGTLRQFFLDNYSARKLELDATTAAPSQLVLTPGSRDLAAMIKDVNDGIYVIGFLGGNMDPVRGDFSYGIVGVAIENGQLTQHVSEMNITGNFTDIMLRLSEVGNDPKRDATHQIPSLRFDDVAFSGT